MIMMMMIITTVRTGDDDDGDGHDRYRCRLELAPRREEAASQGYGPCTAPRPCVPGQRGKE
jgi:hypothetical protein